MEGAEKLILHYSKSSISELALRKALYWITDSSAWSLNDLGDLWEVLFEVDDADKKIKYKFERLLNDYVLREILDRHTNDLKQAIVRKSLKDLSI